MWQSLGLNPGAHTPKPCPSFSFRTSGRLPRLCAWRALGQAVGGPGFECRFFRLYILSSMQGQQCLAQDKKWQLFLAGKEALEVILSLLSWGLAMRSELRVLGCQISGSWGVRVRGDQKEVAAFTVENHRVSDLSYPNTQTLSAVTQRKSHVILGRWSVMFIICIFIIYMISLVIMDIFCTNKVYFFSIFKTHG